MQNLRILRIDMSVFGHGALLLLGKLPCLGTLQLYEASRHLSSLAFFPVAIVALPRNSFPALQDLCLPCLPVSSLGDIWNIEPFVARLKTIKLKFTNLRDESSLRGLFDRICLCSPQIVDLEMDYDTGSVKHITPDFFVPLHQLSLQNLLISGLRRYPTIIVCRTLSAAFLSLQELRLPDLDVLVADLWYFAQFSQLEYLCVGVEWESCELLNRRTPKPVYMSRSLRRFEGSGGAGQPLIRRQIKKAVQFLLSIWPELHWVLGGPESSTPGLINQKLQAFQAARRCRSVI
ncbi:hypothetical protein BDV93DRAFT_554410 [Ceratobasidium sp. AG-I]|nr:hypothetical protein BDV93DRAFT_554410 [Ceratobasidium sp. AG-I]